MGLRAGLRLIRGTRRSLTEKQQHVVDLMARSDLGTLRFATLRFWLRPHAALA
jgi:hypothetical protein